MSEKLVTIVLLDILVMFVVAESGRPPLTRLSFLPFGASDSLRAFFLRAFFQRERFFALSSSELKQEWYVVGGFVC